MTTQTKLINLHINKYQELITFDIVQLGRYPIVLGLPWLVKHDPLITWKDYHIDLNSEYCKEICRDFSSDIEFKEDLLDSFDHHEIISTTLEEIKQENNELNIELPIEYQDFQDIFDKKASEILPPHRPYDHKIPLLPNTQPPFGPIYSLSEIELKTLKEYINENLEKNFIQPSTSPAGSPILFVKKKDGSLRLCVDYRGLNKVTIKNRYPLPLIGELLDRFKMANYFTKIDLRGAYNLVRIVKGDEWKTAFRTRYGHFEYKVMPFGLCNAPASFQYFMNDILSDCLDIFCVVYLDDILIFSPNLNDHIKHVKEILTCLRKNNLFAKLEKCEFHKSSVEFLGYIVSSKGLKMDNNKINAIKDWPIPQNIKDIQTFIGFANFYRRFINKFSFIVTPITNLLKNDVKWNWDELTQLAFDKLKRAFITAPILKYFNPNKPCIIETDSSDFAIGGVISQYDDDNNLLHPIAFFSRKLTTAERNYEIYDKELLSIITAFKEWRAYLEGSQFQITILSDHKNLEYFMTTKQLNRRQARWSEILSNYDFIIKYINGKSNGKSDALSRRPDHQPEEGDEDNQNQTLLNPNKFIIAAVETFNIESNLETLIQDNYNKDPITSELLPYLKNPNLLRTNIIKSKLDNFTYKNYFILFKNLVYIPNNEKLKLKLLNDYHDSVTAGHPGQAKTYELITRNFFWPHMHNYINTYISSCNQCNRCKPSRHKPYGYLQSLPVPNKPWESISMDFIVGLPNSNNYTAILVIVDRFTKMSHFIPTTNEIDAKGTAKLFLDNIYRLHGLPKDIISDRGSVFTLKFWSSLMKLLKVTINLSTAFHPQSDGQTERVNQVLEQYIRLYCHQLQNDWSDLLTLAEYSYNNNQHSTTKFSPFFMNYGQHPTTLPNQFTLSQCNLPMVTDNINKLNETYKIVIENIKQANLQYAKYYNKKHLPDPEFSIGTKVWLSSKNIKTQRPSSKLDYNKLGPFKIISKIGKGAYKLELPITMKIHPVFHVSLFESVIENIIPERY